MIVRLLCVLLPVLLLLEAYYLVRTRQFRRVMNNPSLFLVLGLLLLLGGLFFSLKDRLFSFEVRAIVFRVDPRLDAVRMADVTNILRELSREVSCPMGLCAEDGTWIAPISEDRVFFQIELERLRTQQPSPTVHNLDLPQDALFVAFSSVADSSTSGFVLTPEAPNMWKVLWNKKSSVETAEEVCSTIRTLVAKGTYEPSSYSLLEVEVHLVMLLAVLILIGRYRRMVPMLMCGLFFFQTSIFSADTIASLVDRCHATDVAQQDLLQKYLTDTSEEHRSIYAYNLALLSSRMGDLEAARFWIGLVQLSLPQVEALKKSLQIVPSMDVDTMEEAILLVTSPALLYLPKAWQNEPVLVAQALDTVALESEKIELLLRLGYRKERLYGLLEKDMKEKGYLENLVVQHLQKIVSLPTGSLEQLQRIDFLSYVFYVLRPAESSSWCRALIDLPLLQQKDGALPYIVEALTREKMQTSNFLSEYSSFLDLFFQKTDVHISQKEWTDILVSLSSLGLQDLFLKKAALYVTKNFSLSKALLVVEGLVHYGSASQEREDTILSLASHTSDIFRGKVMTKQESDLVQAIQESKDSDTTCDLMQQLLFVMNGQDSGAVVEPPVEAKGPSELYIDKQDAVQLLLELEQQENALEQRVQ